MVRTNRSIAFIDSLIHAKITSSYPIRMGQVIGAFRIIIGGRTEQQCCRIGTGQGQAIGAWAADGKPVLYFTGDGSFGFYMGEWDTYLRHGIPVICVICNDSSWGMIKLSEGVKRADYIEEHGHLATTLAPMRAYEKMADIWGGMGLRVSKAEDIIPALRKIRESGKPGILNVEVDQHVMSPATRSFAGSLKKK